ncbi:MAG: flagellar biosynthetic protein FliO [Phycisphaerae bacterium]|nr:flagellar biosynthetic protein FliO [Phycisphaerae bacterium]
MFLRRNGKLRFLLVIIGLSLFCPALPCAGQETSSANNPASLDEPGVEDSPIKGSEEFRSGERNDEKGGFSAFSGTLWAALALVLVLIVVALAVIRKAYPGARMFSSLAAVQVLGRTYLSPKQALAMVKVGRKLVLIGLSEQSVSHLLTVSDPDEVAQLLSQIEQGRSTSVTAGFMGLFSGERARFEEEDSEPDPSDKNRENSKENEEESVLELKSELNSLINKINRLKGIGGQR